MRAALLTLALVSCAPPVEGTYRMTMRRQRGSCDEYKEPITVQVDAGRTMRLSSLSGGCPLTEAGDEWQSACEVTGPGGRIGMLWSLSFDSKGFRGQLDQTITVPGQVCTAVYPVSGERQ